MLATPSTPQSKPRISPSSTCKRVLMQGDARDRAHSSSLSTIPFPRARTPSPTPASHSALRRSSRHSHIASDSCGSPSELSPSDTWPGNTTPSGQRYPPFASQLNPTPTDINLLDLIPPQSGPSPSFVVAAARREVAAMNLGLTLDFDFNSPLGLDFDSASSPALSYATPGSSASPGGFLLPSPGDEDVFNVHMARRNGKLHRNFAEPSFELDVVPSARNTDMIPRSTHVRARGRDESIHGFNQTRGIRSRSSSEDGPSDQYVEQQYTGSPTPSTLGIAKLQAKPEIVRNVEDEPQAGSSRSPILDTHIAITTPSPTRCASPPPFPLSGQQLEPLRVQTSGRPPSPTPTADFSMISPPDSPSFFQYSSQIVEDVDVDPFRASHPRVTATLPFFRYNTASPSSETPGALHFSINGRSQSMSAGMGLGPGLGKSRRVRPGISRLWESLASPTKGSSTLPAAFQESTNGAPSQRAKSTPIPGFSVVRNKTSPMMGVGRKLKEKRRIKQSRRGTVEVGIDVDYGALDPLDGEEGELVGCTCTGWGDGECICGYGYWDVYDYGCDQTQEPEPIDHGGPLTRLPPELFLHVLSYLPLRSVLAVASTCKSWRALALDNSVWWGLWQAREGVPRLPCHDFDRSSGVCHRTYDSCGVFGRRYRGVKDEGIHGLLIHTPEPEHEGEQYDGPRGWSVNFDRANMRLKNRRIESCRYLSLNPGRGDRGDNTGRLATWTPSAPQISRQAPLMLDWQKLYRGRSILEQRWRDPEGEPRVLRIEGHKDSVYCLDFDSSRIITGSRDRTIKVWCIKTGKCIATFEGHTGSVLCLKFERDWDMNGEGEVRGFMVSGSSDCTVCVWDLISTPITFGERSSMTTLGGKSGKAKDVPTAVTAGGFGPPRRVSAEIRQILRGHSAGVLDLRMDERWIVTCSKDALMNVYDRKTLKLHTVLRGHEGPVNAVGLENGHVVSASGDGKMMLWDVETGDCIRVFEGHERGLACIEFKDDLILSGSNDCTIKLWRASTGECLHTFAGHTLLVRALCFEPKTGYIVSTSYDRSVRVWEWRERAVDYSDQRDDGAGSRGNTARSKGVGRLVREFRNLHASHIFDVKFDVGKIVSTSHDQKIVVLDFSYGIEGAELFA